MLILTRKPGETIVVGQNGGIKITVLGARGNQVRLGIDAPIEITVHREEIYKRIQKANRAKDDGLLRELEDDE